MSILPPPRSIATPTANRKPYSKLNALDDIPGIHHAVELFLASKMIESERFCLQEDPERQSLYYTTGYGLIQCLKSMMSYEDEDLQSALQEIRHGNNVANQHRKSFSFLSRFNFFSRSTPAADTLSPTSPTNVGFDEDMDYIDDRTSVVSEKGPRDGGAKLKRSTTVDQLIGMTDVERHAELVFAESLFAKSLVTIISSGDWLSLMRQALKMLSSFRLYEALYGYVTYMDTLYTSRVSPLSPTSPTSPSSKRALLEHPLIDRHFRSGVYLGWGGSQLILSLVPGRLAGFASFWGFKGDRELALELLMNAGGWVNDEDKPKVSREQEGFRRNLCDMALLIFHLVLSSITYHGVDIPMAEKILNWNLERYPNGVFFLFGAGRLALCHSQPALALAWYQKALDAQSDYKNLRNISHWELASTYMSLWDVRKSLEYWRNLLQDATWSKASYAYGAAVCLLTLGGEENEKEAAALLARIPRLRQKLAGKSIPLEKFAERKARKFKSQSNKLVLPALEFAYLSLGIRHAAREVIIRKMMPEIELALEDFSRFGEGCEDEYGVGYWDDICLAKFLEGICMRYVAYPDAHAIIDPRKSVGMSKAEAEARSIAAFEFVLENGPRIELDHYLVYYTHYEFGRLLACKGEPDEARNHLEIVVSGKPLEINSSARKGKYSMETQLRIRTNAALAELRNGRSIL
ncbi:hypothetical protein JAAARDRAFT_41924 [Jaapia argillacea MUCL 33604]|uniref:Tetratricopeptide repeat protein 39B n=1 Tax=Jaapia argillacea MUCL 33604 TaxID=933084 RepID=A0A067P6T0_9AGAM|nr:hypothetical protein JAAARDRAFT_41924 [Jaapia argillacea MUCL 33604]